MARCPECPILGLIVHEQTPQHRSTNRVVALQRAAEMVGGQAELAQRLNVPQRQVDYWIREMATPPDAVYFDVLDIIIQNAGAWKPD